LIFRYYQKIQAKRQANQLNKLNQFTVGTSTKIKAVAINEPSAGKEDAIEIFLKNHKNPATLEQQINPLLSVVSTKPQTLVKTIYQ
jgi:acetolactate synthase regulatory subunit